MPKMKSTREFFTVYVRFLKGVLVPKFIIVVGRRYKSCSENIILVNSGVRRSFGIGVSSKVFSGVSS